MQRTNNHPIDVFSFRPASKKNVFIILIGLIYLVYDLVIIASKPSSDNESNIAQLRWPVYTITFLTLVLDLIQNVLCQVKYNNAEDFYEAKAYTEALDEYSKCLSYREHDDAAYSIGWIYEHGLGVDKSASIAKKYYLRSYNINPHHPRALERIMVIDETPNLGILTNWTDIGGRYFTGSDNRPQDYAKAKACYELALKYDWINLDDANYFLGIIYGSNCFANCENGEMSLMYYKKAISLGHAKANEAAFKSLSAKISSFEDAFNLGENFFNGRDGLAINYTYAKDCYEKALTYTFNRVVVYRLGYIFENGLGIEKNLPLAVVLYIRASKCGYEPATDQLDKIRCQQQADETYSKLNWLIFGLSLIEPSGRIETVLSTLFMPVANFLGDATSQDWFPRIAYYGIEVASFFSSPYGYIFRKSIRAGFESIINRLDVRKPDVVAMLKLTADFTASYAARRLALGLSEEDVLSNSRFVDKSENSETASFEIEKTRYGCNAYLVKAEKFGVSKNQPLEIYYIGEDLNSVLRLLSMTIPSAQHTGIIARDPNTNTLYRLELRINGGSNVFSFAEVERVKLDNKHRLYRVGTTNASIQDIAEVGQRWIEENKNYGFNSNCRTLTNALIEFAIHMNGEVSDILNRRIFFKNPVGYIEHRIRKKKSDVPTHRLTNKHG